MEDISGLFPSLPRVGSGERLRFLQAHHQQMVQKAAVKATVTPWHHGSVMKLDQDNMGGVCLMGCTDGMAAGCPHMTRFWAKGVPS